MVVRLLEPISDIAASVDRCTGHVGAGEPRRILDVRIPADASLRCILLAYDRTRAGCWTRVQMLNRLSRWCAIVDQVDPELAGALSAGQDSAATLAGDSWSRADQTTS